MSRDPRHKLLGKDVMKALREIKAAGGDWRPTRSGHIFVRHPDGWTETIGSSPKSRTATAHSLRRHLTKHRVTKVT